MRISAVLLFAAGTQLMAVNSMAQRTRTAISMNTQNDIYYTRKYYSVDISSPE